MIPHVRTIALLALLSLSTMPALEAQVLETETARLLPAGGLTFGDNFEYQHSGDGSETALPMAIEYGISNRLELLVEPVLFTSIRPKAGSHANGVGDVEVTLTYLMRRETPRTPGFAFAGEVKLPTARNVLIGTGKTDFAGYLIASKQFGRLVTHANIGYTIVGQPVGAQLDNIMNGAVAAELAVADRTVLFSEILGNSAAAQNALGESSTTPEAASGEIVGTVGVVQRIGSMLELSFGVSYDNKRAVLFRPGFVYHVR
jgi:hypothetical protein